MCNTDYNKSLAGTKSAAKQPVTWTLAGLPEHGSSRLGWTLIARRCREQHGSTQPNPLRIFIVRSLCATQRHCLQKENQVALVAKRNGCKAF
jgi:hypothetical protein